MEQNLPIIITKKVWRMMKMGLLMLRKGICKKKLMLDLNMMMKRAKITATTTATVVWPTNDPREYEFNCKNTPLYRHYFNTNKSKNINDQHNNFYIMPSPNVKDQVEFEAVNKVLETMLTNKRRTGNGKQRQLSISDAPFMLENEGQDNQRVDEAAEDFIKNFYNQLKAQDC